MVKRLSNVDQNDNGLVNVPDGVNDKDAVNRRQLEAGLEDKVDGKVRVSSSAEMPVAPQDGDIWVDPSDSEEPTSLLELTYPVGSLYMNRTNATNPATLFGFGTWIRIQDKMIMARGTTYTADGGSATHNHGLSAGRANISASGTRLSFERTTESFTSNVSFATSGGSTGSDTITTKTLLSGSTDSNSNIPPMITAYVWERTA